MTNFAFLVFSYEVGRSITLIVVMTNDYLLPTYIISVLLLRVKAYILALDDDIAITTSIRLR